MPGYGNIDSWDPKKNRDMSWLGSLFSGASGLFGGILNETFSDKHLKDAQNFSLMQGDIDWQRQQTAFNMSNQRADDVWNRQQAANLAQWERENAYNSPAAQMQRFKEAGLNPHLIYGQSNTGGSIATANLDSASMGGGSSSGVTQARGNDWQASLQGVGNVMMNYLSLKEKAANVDNLGATNDLLRKDALIKDLDIALGPLKKAGLISDNLIKEATAKYAPELSRLSVQAKEQDVKTAMRGYEFMQYGETRSREAHKALMSQMAVGTAKSKLEAAREALKLKYESAGPSAVDFVDRVMGKYLKMLNDIVIGSD